MMVKAVFAGKAETYFPDSDFIAVPGHIYDVDIEKMSGGAYRFRIADISRRYVNLRDIEKNWLFDMHDIAAL